MSDWTKQVQDALENAKLPETPKNKEIKISAELQTKIKHKNELRKEYQRTRHPATKTIVNKLQKEIKTQIQEEIKQE